MRSLSLVLAAAIGCGGGGYRAQVSYADPELVYVSPGVYGVTNAHDPVFYADDYYWRYDAGYWYRSPRYYDGWRRATPPISVRRIDRPGTYVRGRPSGRIHVDVREERVRDRHRDTDRSRSHRGQRRRVRVIDRD